MTFCRWDALPGSGDVEIPEDVGDERLDCVIQRARLAGFLQQLLQCGVGPAGLHENHAEGARASIPGFLGNCGDARLDAPTQLVLLGAVKPSASLQESTS